MFFHALTFAGSLVSCLNMRPIGRVLKHLQRDLASVNAMKQTCVIVILAYFAYSNQIHSENADKTLKHSFSYAPVICIHCPPPPTCRDVRG